MRGVLERFRKPGKTRSFYKFFGYFLFAIICLSFVFVGLSPSQTSLTGTSYAAIVGDELISINEFQRSLAQMESQFGEFFKQMPRDRQQMQMKIMREQVLNDLIRTSVLTQNAEKVGFSPAKAVIQQQISEHKAFQNEGRFSKDLYRRVLAANQMTPTQFEDLIRRGVVMQSTRDLFAKSLKAPKVSLALTEEAQNTKLNIEFIKLDKEKLKAKIVGENEITSFLTSAEGRAKVEEKYRQNQVQYAIPEEVKAQHILIKSDGSIESDRKALEKLESIKLELKTKPFSEVAKIYSEDPGSKAKGGDLGYFGRGKMVPEFESQAFSQALGTVSEPVKTNYGYHLIKVEDRRGGGTKELKAVEREIAKALISDELLASKIKNIEDLASNSKALDQELNALGFKWEESGEFDLTSSAVPKAGLQFEKLEPLVSQGVSSRNAKVISDADSSYLVRLKDVRKVTKEQNSQNAFSYAGFEAFDKFTQGLEAEARIEKNLQILAN
jgi:peptidyl-prolyl cis-trans isomerase D